MLVAGKPNGAGPRVALQAQPAEKALVSQPAG